MRMPAIALAVLDHRPDVVVLIEFRRTTGGQIAGVLADHGLWHQACTDPGPGTNGILIASRFPLTDSREPSDARARRWIESRIDALDVTLAGIHAPDASSARAQRSYWQSLIEDARVRAGANLLLLGDFNTGRRKMDEEGATFRCTSLLGNLCTLGFTDCWRAAHPERREYTWFSHAGSGFRIDAVYSSAGVRERVQHVAHSMLIATVEGADPPARKTPEFWGVFNNLNVP